MVNYRVFLSFRGEDTRDNLVEYLYKKLDSSGIVTFRDREEIKDGDKIDSTIEEAIQRSDICVPIFSPDFASSRSCLMEVDCMVRLGKEIHPIFFFVKPSDVKYQRGAYKQSFAAHESRDRIEESTITDWKNALTRIGDIKGLEFKNPALEATLDAALENIGGNGIKGTDFKKAVVEAAMETIDGMKGCEFITLDAALEEIGVIKGPELMKAVEAALEKIGGLRKAALKAVLEAALANARAQFCKALFNGFQELETFISELWKLLKKDEQVVTRDLVGIDRDMPEIMRKLGFCYQNGQIVKKGKMAGRWMLVVWGLPGAGKTTLTKEVFNKIRHLFKGCSFLEDVPQGCEKERVLTLQRKLISDLKRGECPKVGSPTEATAMIKHLFQEDKVLIVLDDVDDLDQIKPFAEELTWFGPGSTIILTTKTKHVYEQGRRRICGHHEVKLMDENHALQLFSKCAFRSDHPPKDCEEMSKQIISAVDKSPFAIGTVGRSLYRESQTKWERTLGDLHVKPGDKVEKILEESYKLLSYEAREVFLDVACFFTGVEKTIPCYLWAAREQGRGVDELKKKSLLQVRENKEFWMSGQLKLLGRNLVKSKYPHNPGKRSRLWDGKDVRTILREKTGIYKVTALRVPPEFKRVDGEVFRCLLHLKFLELDNVDIEGNTKNILPSLEWLDWRGCREKSKLFAFHMEDLVILKLCSSSVQLSLKDWGQLMEKARSLKVLNLKDCRSINASLEFPASEHLECLILEACLYIKPETVSNFKNLVSLSMKNCKQIKELPRAIASTALKELLIDGTSIKRLHFEKDSLPALKTLSACECKALREVTDSIGFLTNLRKLALRSCNQLKTLPHVFGELAQLEKMDLSHTSIKELPPCVEDCRKLQVLKMARTFLRGVPEAIKHLEELKELDFTNCRSLSGHCDITGLSSLTTLRLKGTGITELARDEGQFCLDILELEDHVTERTRPGQEKTSVPNLKRKGRTQTCQKNSCVSQGQNKKRRGEE